LTVHGLEFDRPGAKDIPGSPDLLRTYPVGRYRSEELGSQLLPHRRGSIRMAKAPRSRLPHAGLEVNDFYSFSRPSLFF
jgi:hypothetical protein